MKKMLMAINCLLSSFVVADSLKPYLNIDAGMNFINLHNKMFRQSPTYRTDYVYRDTIKFASLGLDVGFETSKTFRFLKHDNTFMCGVRGEASSTHKTITGKMMFEDFESDPVYRVAHDFNIAALAPYVGIMFNGIKSRCGITASVKYYDSLLKKLRARENVNQNWYTGIYLMPGDYKALAGSFRVFIDKSWEDDFIIRVSYEYTRGHQKYDRHVFIEPASIGTADYLQDLHLLAGATKNELLESPVIRFGIHTFCLSFGINF